MHTPYNTNPTRTSGRPASTVYFHTGIGGAGNYHKQTVVTAPPPAGSRQLQKHHSGLPRSFRAFFSTSIGGAGNIHPIIATAAEDEYIRSRTRESRFPARWFTGIVGSRRSGERLSSSSSSEEGKRTAMIYRCGNDAKIWNGQALPYGAADILKVRLRRLARHM